MMSKLGALKKNLAWNPTIFANWVRVASLSFGVGAGGEELLEGVHFDEPHVGDLAAAEPGYSIY